ncbi:MAG: uracil-DNA glycosylase [Pseudonocardiales bacterium]|nr:MAG: uracil-DNA glycosylase [Pseudonocardiales bacterium]
MTEVSKDYPGAQAFVPKGASIADLARAARGCQGCELHRPATQTVFGSGQPSSRIVFVGEQPGDVEDRRGEPFVGPAGRLLDRALADAGIDREQAYVTNAVKHFRFTGTPGKRRIHQKPDASHMAACRPWLDAELAQLAPEVVVALGATAAAVLIGPAFRVTRQRGQLMPWDGPSGAEDAGVHSGWIVATIHPSAVLRTEGEGRDAAFAGLVSDLKVAAAALAG